MSYNFYINYRIKMSRLYDQLYAISNMTAIRQMAPEEFQSQFLTKLKLHEKG
jgi:hypothetical protein